MVKTLSAFLKDSGVSWEKDVMNGENYVFEFPVKLLKVQPV